MISVEISFVCTYSQTCNDSELLCALSEILNVGAYVWLLCFIFINANMNKNTMMNSTRVLYLASSCMNSIPTCN